MSPNKNENNGVDVYDILFAPKLSGERRLDRPFRRRLQLKPKRQHSSIKGCVIIEFHIELVYSSTYEYI